MTLEVNINMELQMLLERYALKTKKRIKNIFTKVLKGHIAVVTTNLTKDKTGKQIDKRARKYLKKDGMDYAHGTGHGVGFFSNVHEGPQSITKFNKIKLEEE